MQQLTNYQQQQDSRAGWGKIVLGSVAEEVIREATCPVLTVGPHVTALASAGVHGVVCATDFSLVSLRAVEFAMSLACEYEAHLTFVHVVEGSLKDSPHLATQLSENRLREMIPSEPELLYRPEVVIQTGAVAERILNLAADLSADFIVMSGSVCADSQSFWLDCAQGGSSGSVSGGYRRRPTQS